MSERLRIQKSYCRYCGCRWGYDRDAEIKPRCPRCGIVPAGIVRRRRANQHRILTAVAAFPIGVVFVMSLIALPIPTACAIVTVVGVVCLLSQAVVCFIDPNISASRNQKQAAELVSEGSVVRFVDEPDATELNRKPTHGFAGRRFPVFVLGAVGVVLITSPEFVRKQLGWPLNANVPSTVVSPGDEITLWFDERIPTINGEWRGEPDVGIVIARGQKVPTDELNIRTSEDDWSDWIFTKSTSDQLVAPWVTLRVPERAILTGRTLKLSAKMNVISPRSARDGRDDTFVDGTTVVYETLELRIAPPKASTAYQTLWWLASTVGAVILLGSGALLATDFEK